MHYTAVTCVAIDACLRHSTDSIGSPEEVLLSVGSNTNLFTV